MRDNLDRVASDNGAEAFCALCEAINARVAVWAVVDGVLAMMVVGVIT